MKSQMTDASLWLLMVEDSLGAIQGLAALWLRYVYVCVCTSRSPIFLSTAFLANVVFCVDLLE